MMREAGFLTIFPRIFISNSFFIEDYKVQMIVKSYSLLLRLNHLSVFYLCKLRERNSAGVMLLAKIVYPSWGG